MIKRVVLKNFKRIEKEIFDLTDFDLLVGSNNSGKSTLLQALAIWQYCIDQFLRTKRSGSRGIQVVLPDFTALPLPEFVLLWKDKVERKNIKREDGKTKPDFVLIEIEVQWEDDKGKLESLNVQLRYQSPLSIYAIPELGLERLRELAKSPDFPSIVYVPPFSGLEPVEKWQDDGNVRQNVGKGQPGSVLRNLLFRVVDRQQEDGHAVPPHQIEVWRQIQQKIEEWFGVRLNPPEYEKGQSTMIRVTYSAGKKDFDIISGGSGFHQILTLLAFFYGYQGVTTILFDEPDAHLHINLQRNVLSYFKQNQNIQFIIATHSEEFIRGVEVSSITSMLAGAPKKVQSTQSVLRAMSDVENIDIVKTKQSPFILYIEGEDDERLLTAWAEVLGKTTFFTKFHLYKMGGGNKKDMVRRADEHFAALKEINTSVSRVVLLDYDTEDSFHPSPDNPVRREWRRKNIENYQLVPEAWKTALLNARNRDNLDMFSPFHQESQVIDSFFSEQGLVLPKDFSWKKCESKCISRWWNGKKSFFYAEDSLFNRIKRVAGLQLNRDRVARAMKPDQVHQDIWDFFEILEHTVSQQSRA
ncbi:MAG: AAA family ATPase [Cytophagales bacterium]|nr:AAA family ATPase [Cytophagales bacterium]